MVENTFFVFIVFFIGVIVTYLLYLAVGFFHNYFNKNSNLVDLSLSPPPIWTYPHEENLHKSFRPKFSKPPKGAYGRT